MMVDGLSPSAEIHAPRPSISVIIPAYNAERTLATAVRSVLEQTVQPAEVIVVDDGSTDATAAIAMAMHPRVKLIQQENKGCGEARNTGARAANGDWLAFLDADDAWLPRKLESQVSFTSNARVAVVNCRLKNKRGEVLDETIPFERLWCRNELIVSSALVRRVAFEAAGGFWSRRYCEDYHLWLRLAGEGWIIANCREDLVVYSPAPGSLSQQSECFATTEVACIEDVAERLGFSQERRNQRLISAYLGHARSAIHARDLVLARKFVRCSLTYGLSIRQLIALLIGYTPISFLNVRRYMLNYPRNTLSLLTKCASDEQRIG